MTIVLASTVNTAVINAACDTIVDLVDGGAGPGTIVLQTAANAEVATVTFGDPAFGAAVVGVATANATVGDSSATGSVSQVTKFRVFDSDAVEIWQGTVSEISGGGDLEVDDGTVGGGVIIDATAIFTITSIIFTVTT